MQCSVCGPEILCSVVSVVGRTAASTTRRHALAAHVAASEADTPVVQSPPAVLTTAVACEIPLLFQPSSRFSPARRRRVHQRAALQPCCV